MPDGLYERDALEWADRQATLLRRLAAGERVNDAVDWAHVIEEVQDVGLSELRACRSLLLRALVHLMKMAAWPGSQSFGHWSVEATVFLADAADAFAPSMRQRIDLAAVYADALGAFQWASDDSGAPGPVMPDCPFALDDLLHRDLAALVRRLGGGAG